MAAGCAAKDMLQLGPSRAPTLARETVPLSACRIDPPSQRSQRCPSRQPPPPPCFSCIHPLHLRNKTHTSSFHSEDDTDTVSDTVPALRRFSTMPVWPPNSTWYGKSQHHPTAPTRASDTTSFGKPHVLMLCPDDEALVEYYTTHAVPIHLQPGVLVASILVSVLGSYATLLVLGRRTSARGFRNLSLLLLAAVCFAAVAVWGMHFVSMISIRLRPTPDYTNKTWYLIVSGGGPSACFAPCAHTPFQFSPGMTALSLFVPLIATSFAFWFMGSEAEFVWWRGLVSGVMVGLTSKSPLRRAHCYAHC